MKRSLCNQTPQFYFWVYIELSTYKQRKDTFIREFRWGKTALLLREHVNTTSKT